MLTAVVVVMCVVQVVDVTTGAKFYGPGKMYHQFAGTVRSPCCLYCLYGLRFLGTHA